VASEATVAGDRAIAAAFAAHGRRAALMPYLMGGFPDLEGSRAIGQAYADNGADLVELGVPYSDPLADGPVIQAAGDVALRAGATLRGVIDVGRSLAESVPVVLMCYANLVLARGPERFADDLATAGISGLIVPDLPLEESAEILGVCDAAGIALVPLVAPTSPDARLERIGAQARGFIYTVSVVGITGERAGVNAQLGPLLARMRERTSVPVAMGFGISTPDDADQAAAAGAEGVIIGTRLVRAAAEAGDGAAAAAAVGPLVAGFAEALR
jgi:tryptophan synthase alpha chain